MTTTTSFLDPKTSAFPVMDFQPTIVDGYAADKDALLGRTAKLSDSTRKAGMRAICVVVGFRPATRR